MLGTPVHDPYHAHLLMPTEHVTSNTVNLRFLGSVPMADACTVQFSVTYTFLIPAMSPSRSRPAVLPFHLAPLHSSVKELLTPFVNLAVRLLPSHLTWTEKVFEGWDGFFCSFVF